MEAIKGERTISELGIRYGLHPNMITNWKRQAIENLAETFSTKAERTHEQYLKTPFYGHRQMTKHLRREGYVGSRTRIGRLMKLMGLSAIYQKPNTLKPHPQHKIYPYLLRDMTIDRPNQVWCADISYIPMRRGFLYLVAIWGHRREELPGNILTKLPIYSFSVNFAILMAWWKYLWGENTWSCGLHR